MKFTIHKIDDNEVPKQKNWFQLFVERHGTKSAIFSGIGVIAILLIAFAFYATSSLLSTKTDTGLFRVETDDTGHTNILFLGVAGDNEEGNEGYNLADSIIIASINHEPASISFVSIPRDLWVDSPIGSRKINSIYAYALAAYKDSKALETIKETIGDFAGIKIHHAAVVDFKVFKESIDALGGIDIYVPETITDTQFPGPNYSYETFIVRRGQQKFDGETTLKYARSRKSTSDYDRAKRQQDILLAIRKKAADLNLFTDTSKLKSLYNIYSKNVNTDISLTEAITLAKLANKISYNNALSFVLNNDPYQMGGVLYAPRDHSKYGQFVILPRDRAQLKQFFTLSLKNPSILLEKEQIEILNASDTSGLAGRTSQYLKQLGFLVVNVDNANLENPPKFTTIERVNMAPNSQTYVYLKGFFGAQESTIDTTKEQPADSIATIRIILGEDAIIGANELTE